MATEDRFKQILERQEAAAEKRRLDQEAADTAAEKASILRRQVLEKWSEQRLHIEHFIERVNQDLAPSGTKLFVRKTRPGDQKSRQLDELNVGFEEYENYSDLRKLWLSVRPDGCIHVGMGMRNHSPAKNYELNVLKATSADLEGTVLDFLDVNTPK
jgi:hypothetical protein